MNSRYSCVLSNHGFLSPEQSHLDFLFSENVFALGRFHWFLEHGDRTIYEEAWEEVADQDDFGTEERVQTQFGRELNGDPIYWWVSKFSLDLHDLESRTLAALEAAETFKDKTKQFKYNEKDYGSYRQLLAELQMLAEVLRPSVEKLTDYARWLHSQDVKGPGILFSYRVWGTTRRGERHFELQSNSAPEEPTESIMFLSLVVLGLWSNKLNTFDRELFHKADDFYYATQGEEVMFRVSEARLMRRVSKYAADQLAEYAIFVRDSLKNILIEIEKCETFRQTLLSDRFLREFIEAARNSPKQEPLYWDFKQTLEMWHAKGKAKEDAKIKLCEHVAAGSISFFGRAFETLAFA